VAEHWIGPGFLIIPWLICALLSAVIARRRGGSAALVVIVVLAVTWAFVIVAASLFPFPLPAYLSDPIAGAPFSRLPNEWLNPYPFHTIANAIKGIGSAAAFALGNIVAYIPLGLLIGLLDPRARWLRVVGVALLCSGGIELLQLGISVAVGFPFRAADIDDVLLNVLGALAGYAIVRPLPVWRLGLTVADRRL